MKIITKKNCDRCVKVKDYMKEKGINYEEILVENPTDLELYRKMLIDNNKQLGFPILLKDSEIINGQSEEIISWLNKQYPEKKESIYFWGE